jgi:hypothetical protein
MRGFICKLRPSSETRPYQRVNLNSMYMSELAPELNARPHREIRDAVGERCCSGVGGGRRHEQPVRLAGG